MMSSRSIIIVLTLALLTNGCAHKVDTPVPYDEMRETQISVTQPWTAKGKLLVTAQDTRQSLRFTWRHQVEGEDVITLSDTLGIKALVYISATAYSMSDSPINRSQNCKLINLTKTSEPSHRWRLRTLRAH